jgi:flagellar hook-basal body complex protein FliE
MAEIKNRATLDSTQFQAGLKGMQGQVQGLAGALKSLPGIGGALSIAGLAAGAASAMKAADEIDNLSNQMSMGVEAVQAYKVGLKEAGLGMGDLQRASDRLKRAQAEAMQGSEKARQSFRALGIDMKSLQGADATRLLELVGQGLSDTQGKAEATSAQFDLLGRGSERLKNVLIEMNKDGIQAQINSMKELGLVIDESMIARLDAAQLRMERFGTQSKNVFASLTTDAIQGFEMMGNMFGGMSLDEAFAATEAVNAQALATRDLARAREAAARAADAEAQGEAVQAGLQNQLNALRDKRRLQQMNNDELRAELNTRLANAQIDEIGAQRTGDRAAELAALERIHEIERQIAAIKDADVKDLEGPARANVLAEIDKLRLAKLSNEELREELTLRGRAARAAFDEAKTWVEKETALKKMLDIESQLSRIRDEAAGSISEGSKDVSRFERLGTASALSEGPDGSKSERRAATLEQLQRRILQTNIEQVEALREIMRERGAIL